MIKVISQDGLTVTAPQKLENFNAALQESIDPKKLIETLKQKLQARHLADEQTSIIVYGLASENSKKKSDNIKEKTLYVLVGDRQNGGYRIYCYHLPSETLDQSGNNDVIAAVLGKDDERRNGPVKKQRDEKSKDGVVDRTADWLFSLGSRKASSPKIKPSEIEKIAESEHPSF